MTVFVTYRLADSLPFAVADAYRTERRRLDRAFDQNPFDPEIRKERARLFCERLDRLLDGGSGSCALRREAVGRLVMGNLQYHNGSLYTLDCAVVMPNHVHVLATLDESTTLATVTHAWKSYTGKEAAKLRCATPFWQDESYDHLVRDEGELEAYRRYILANPIKAGLERWPWIYQAAEIGTDAGGPPAPRSTFG